MVNHPTSVQETEGLKPKLSSGMVSQTQPISRALKSLSMKSLLVGPACTRQKFDIYPSQRTKFYRRSWIPALCMFLCFERQGVTRSNTSHWFRFMFRRGTYFSTVGCAAAQKTSKTSLNIAILLLLTTYYGSRPSSVPTRISEEPNSLLNWILTVLSKAAIWYKNGHCLVFTPERPSLFWAWQSDHQACVDI